MKEFVEGRKNLDVVSGLWTGSKGERIYGQEFQEYKEDIGGCFLSWLFFPHFKEEYGFSPREYLLKLRVEYALCLREEGYLWKQIAEMAGYSSPSSLFRVLSEIRKKFPKNGKEKG